MTEMRIRNKMMMLALTVVGCAPAYPTREALGEALFFDTALSSRRSQSCATCHDPERAFTDSRRGDGGLVMAVSRGDDGVSLGDRNTPSAAYAALQPTFHVGSRSRFNKQNNHKQYEGPQGGFFWDGRAGDLEGQAGGPPLNPIEMGMPDEASVVARLAENRDYETSFRALFGEQTWKDPAVAYAAMSQALAAYERSPVFAPFDSRYDRFLSGEATLSFKELTGKSLFFSEFTNCAICHQLYGGSDPVNKTRETFSGYEYHNVGTPQNVAVRALNGVTGVDPGLGGVGGGAVEHRGQFKTPSLRNVAVTGPYMHNGVFRELRTVIEFYERNTNPTVRTHNPETGAPWADAEVPETVATELLKVGDPLTDDEIDALVCFLRTLTDQRYEPLLDHSLECAD